MVRQVTKTMLKPWADAVKQATTKEQLHEITYQVFLKDSNALKGGSLYEQVVHLAVAREFELEDEAAQAQAPLQ